MKRFISILLVVFMLGGMLGFLSSCKRIDSGTDAAKLLLANERLNGNDFKTVDLGLDEPAKTVDTTVVSSKKTTSGNIVPLSTKPMEATEEVTWSNFPKHSHSMVEFTQFMKNIEKQAERSAKDISRMKNKVGITDKWVKGGLGEEQMLRVYENMDIIIIRNTQHNEIRICKRYTNENARNVYEMYIFTHDGNEISGRIKTLFIPGERYEYMYDHIDGFADYFIAENSRGYWLANRFTVGDEGSATHFSPLIIKDGLGYGAHVSDNSEGEFSPIWYDVFDPVNDIELFRIYDYGNRAAFNLYFTAIQDGFVSASSNERVSDLDGDKKYQTSFITKLETEKGVYTSQEESDVIGRFYQSGGYVQYYYGENMYYGSMEFSVNYEKGKEVSDYTSVFGNYATDIGLTLSCNMDTVNKAIYHANLLGKEFSSVFEWNGITMSSVTKAREAKAVLYDMYDSAYNMYNEVKDFESTNERQRLSNSADFADVAVMVDGENTYANGIVTISGIKLQTTDVALFEEGGKYLLKVGLALCDKDGNPVSANTVSLNGSTEDGVIFAGTGIELTQSGSYAIPKNLSQGEYALVAYITTEDGIRVSKMESVAFLSISGGTVESSAMDISASAVNENQLRVTYTIKNIIRLEEVATKDNYSYDEIRRIIMIEILAKGTPDDEAVLEYEDGTAVKSGVSLGKGTYRMTAYFPTADGLAHSYVYLTIK